MYISTGIIVFLLLLCFLLCIFRRKRAIKQVCSMTATEKYTQLSTLLSPFGYCYDHSRDIISSLNDSWQRRFGYTAFFDKAAPLFHMVFDALPIYFDYQERTWLIEFWKGQYGINTGGEIGVYYTDEIISEKRRSAELFKAVTDADMLPLSFELLKNNYSLLTVSKSTWWLTAFCMGEFSKPADLYLNAIISFPNYEMQRSFLTALLDTGIPEKNVRLSGKQVKVLFTSSPASVFPLHTRIIRKLSLSADKILCRLFLFLTKPFILTADRLLFLYYMFPFVRKKILSPRKYRHRYLKQRVLK